MSAKTIRQALTSSALLLSCVTASYAAPPVAGLADPWSHGRPTTPRTDKSGQEQPSNALHLEVGQQHVLSAKGVRSYSEGTRGIVDVRLTRKGDQFVLVGQDDGQTTLLLMMTDGSERHVNIVVGDPKEPEESPSTHEVAQEDNIRLDFYFVQLDRSNAHQIGLGTPGSLGVNGGASFDFMTQRFQSATAVVENQALLRLDIAQSGGWAKLMRKAAVITENGKRAQFSGGGEVNLPLQGGLATGIHSIDYGSRIEVLPRYDSKTGRLQIELSADVSDLTDDRGTGAPGRVTASLSSIVNLELGQALVLAGLSSESQMKSRSGIPVLSQLPIVGYFFGSERFTRQAADNVIFIVPTVLDAASRDARDQIQSAFKAYQNYKGKKEQRKQLRETWRIK